VNLPCKLILARQLCNRASVRSGAKHQSLNAPGNTTLPNGSHHVMLQSTTLSVPVVHFPRGEDGEREASTGSRHGTARSVKTFKIGGQVPVALQAEPSFRNAKGASRHIQPCVLPALSDAVLHGHRRNSLPEVPPSRDVSKPRSASSGSRSVPSLLAPIEPKRSVGEPKRSVGVPAAWKRAGELRDPEVAEAFGREDLGTEEWREKVFRFIDDNDSAGVGYLLPAEFAMLASRLQYELGNLRGPTSFDFHFRAADDDRDGRLSIDEWKDYAEKMERCYGNRSCKRAAMRILGARKAEDRSLKNNCWVFNGYNHEESLTLMRCCAKWGNPHLLMNLTNALERKADPNCAMSTPAYNGYTPLIFLSMAQPADRKGEVSEAMDFLISAKADVHRECDKMSFGKWPPIRFAAQLQNRAGLAALLPHVDIGDVFSWAAKEAVEYIMLDELEKVCGPEVSGIIAARDTYSNQATVLMQLFASSLVGGDLTPDGAKKLIRGEYRVWSLKLGHRADPNGAGLDGLTALMQVILKDDLETVKAMLEVGATPNQRDSRDVTPLHFAAMQLQPEIAKVLLQAGADVHDVDNAGFSAWMLVGEHRSQMVGAEEKMRIQELLELMKPQHSPEQIVESIESGTWESTLGEEGVDLENMRRRWRLRESLFFDHKVCRRGAADGRHIRDHVMKRVASILIDLLKKDPLVGNQKILTKYLLEATTGPRDPYACDHIKVEWKTDDNRSSYRSELASVTEAMLSRFGVDCGVIKDAIQEEADSNPEGSCAGLLALPADIVEIPAAWQEADPFWKQVQERQLLRYDPPWSVSVETGLTCCLAMLRLGVVHDLSGYCYLQQVKHSSMEEMLARCYQSYSELCNESFQKRMKEIAERIAFTEGLDIRPPKEIVKAKQLKRLMEKTAQASVEFGNMEWEGRTQDHLEICHCFHILDTVRLSFTCGGDTAQEQVACSMKLLSAFRACTLEKDNLVVLRQKSGFATGINNKGGYADVKLLVYADLGTHPAFDGTEVPLQIVGEVQLILADYIKVKSRMHLVYEIDRGSFEQPSKQRL